MKKMKKKHFLCVLLAALMALSLCACGGEKAPTAASADHYDFGEYTLDYKGSCIMYSESGDDALVMTFDFTNNSKSAASYGWTIYETAVQDGVELESVFVITDMETFTGAADNYFIDAEPGGTLEIGVPYKLNGMGKVSVTISDLFDKHTYTIEVDPSALERVENEYSAWDWGDLDGDTTTPDSGAAELSFTDWWTGDWYGWWVVKSGSGAYEDYGGYWWDMCAKIEANDDLSGKIMFWDTDGDINNLCGEVEVSFNEAGTGEHGTMFSESGAFVDDVLEHADWIVDPGLEKIDDLIWIDGSYDGDEGSYSYEMYLRPWGTLWDDVNKDTIGYEDGLPYTYDWYLSLVNAGAAMPDSFDAEASAEPEQTEQPAEQPEQSGEEGGNYGKSNASATGFVEFDVLDDCFDWLQKETSRENNYASPSYETIREHLGGTDGAKSHPDAWKEWNDGKEGYHIYKWSTPDTGDFLVIGFKVAADGSENYGSVSWSSALEG